MLHSLQYYACCYALLCLLHQQQRAASLTIIIDGATTNEWATQDEYRRMLEAGSDLESALSQQQQQEQSDYQQEQDQDQQPAPPLPLPIRHLTERNSAPQRYCGRPLMDMLELVCHGVYHNHEIKPQIVEPVTKSKRASRLRALSQSQSQQQAAASSTSLKQPPQQLSLSRQHHHQPPPPTAVQLDGEESLAAEERNSRLQQMQMLLPAHLTIGDQLGQSETDNTNDGDTMMSSTNININPLTNRPRNRYNRMVLSRRARGASEECCKRPCDMDTLQTYCKS